MYGTDNDDQAAYSDQDLKYAAEFRDEIHREALAKVRRVYPLAGSVIDRYAVEDYFQQHWDYPGKWYTIVAIPKESGSREALVDAIAQGTIEYVSRNKILPDARVEYRCADDPFYKLIAQYPDCIVDYCIVTGDPLGHRGCASHWQALEIACRLLFGDGGEDAQWQYDVNRARGKRIDAEALFTSAYEKGKLTYREAFLYPVCENGCTDADFVKVNAALFPNGTDGLEVYEWTTDWSEYFDEGRACRGAVCLTVYDEIPDRFVVIAASAD